ncbi:preprotein translocase subunit SecY [[Clostridium] innocuum]|nr:preprotein translocase subunit SecY [[Clostridium] innocuum]
MFRTFADMFKNKDIRNRIFFTLAMLFVFRFGSAITVPGVDVTELTNGIQDNSLFAMINMLGGGGLEQLSIFAMGVGPYITASIIIQLLSMDVIPALTELAKGGATGKKQIDRYTRYLAVVLSFFQASTLVYSFSTQYTTLLVNGSGWASILYVATLLTAGSMFILWIGDRISMKGIGNGVSMIIAAGIIARLPYQFTTAWQTLVDPSNSSATFNGILTYGLYIVSYLLIIVFVVFMQTAERKIPIQYTSSTVTTRKKDMTYLPLKINSASVIPVIFASAILAAPLQICKMVWPAAGWVKTMETYMGMQTPISLVIYVILIFLFTFFYTKLQVDPEKIAENLGKSGTYIPGIRPGTETKEYVNKVLCRITVLGAIGLAFIAVLPHALPLIPGINLPQSMGIGGTGIIIVVGVAMETVKQIEGRLTQKSYRGFLQR